MICVECGGPVAATHEQMGLGVALTRCRRCGGTADKYVEYELTLKGMDLVLHKAAVYRHFLYNKFDRRPGQVDPALLSLALLLIATDTVRRVQVIDPNAWETFCGALSYAATQSDTAVASTGLKNISLLVLVAVALAAMDFFSYIGGILFMTRSFLSRNYPTPPIPVNQYCFPSPTLLSSGSSTTTTPSSSPQTSIATPSFHSPTLLGRRRGSATSTISEPSTPTHRTSGRDPRSPPWTPWSPDSTGGGGVGSLVGSPTRMIVGGTSGSGIDPSLKVSLAPHEVQQWPLAAVNVMYDMSTVANALILSCFGKLLFLATTIWDYPPEFVSLIGVIVVSSNAVALHVAIDSSPSQSFLLALAGPFAQVIVGTVLKLALGGIVG